MADVLVGEEGAVAFGADYLWLSSIALFAVVDGEVAVQAGGAEVVQVVAPLALNAVGGGGIICAFLAQRHHQ